MRILFFTNSFDPDPIGIAYYNTEWVEALVAAGHQVTVLTALPYYPQWKVEKPYQGRWSVSEERHGARVKRLSLYVPSQQTAWKRFWCEWSFMMHSLPYVLWMDADLLIAVSPPFGIAVAATLARRIRRMPLWLHLQDLQVDAGAAVGFLKGNLLLSGLRRLERWVYGQADHLTTISASMWDRLASKGLPMDRLGLFPNWVHTDDLKPGPRDNAFRHAHQWDEKFVVLYAGSLGIHQGWEILIEAAARLIGEREILFVVAGEGNGRGAFEAALRQRGLSNVQMLPLQPKVILPEMFRAADAALVMEMRRMANLSMPSKILNPMACGCPILAVASEESLLSRTIHENGLGDVILPGQADVLAARVLQWKEDSARVQRYGQAARKWVETYASASDILGRLPHHLEETSAKGYREYRGKRILDAFLALLAFIMTAPLWVIIPLLIWLEDRGPLFYQQMRVGRYGTLFGTFKFRSMRIPTDQRDHQRQAAAGDPRITRIGALLRKTALDELPQLWNILIGDMSFVGPRAHLEKEIEVGQEDRGPVPIHEVPGYRLRSVMRPGLTGIAQIYARRDIPRRQKFRYDGIYLHHQSLPIDLRILFRSVWNTFGAGWGNVGRQRGHGRKSGPAAMPTTHPGLPHPKELAETKHS